MLLASLDSDADAKTKNGPSAKSSGHSTESHMQVDAALQFLEHVGGARRHLRDRYSQAFIFRCSSASVYCTECKPNNDEQKTGEAQERD